MFDRVQRKMDFLLSIVAENVEFGSHTHQIGHLEGI
jgi:hypothetical protein